MVTERDICCRGVAEGLDAATTPTRAIMARDITVCLSDDRVPRTQFGKWSTGTSGATQ